MIKYAFSFLISALLVGFLSAQDIPPPAQNLELIPADSYIIPLDYEKQNKPYDLGNSFYYYYNPIDIDTTVFNLAAYGLANHLMANNIEIKWVIRAGKQKDEIDFTADASKIFPFAAPSQTENFRASAFVIPATDISICDPDNPQQGIDIDALISDFGESVSVYKLTNDEMLDVRYTLRNSPQINILQDGGASYALTHILDSAKIAYELLYNDDFINAPECNTIVCQPHIGSYSMDADYTAALTAFVNAGGNLYAQCLGLVSFEEDGLYQSTAGFLVASAGVSDNINVDYYNADMPVIQFEGIVPDGIGGSTGTYSLNFGSVLGPNTYLQMTDNNPDIFLCSVSDINGDDAGGNVIYLGGHDYQDLLGVGWYGYGTVNSNEAIQQSIQAQRIFLNSMFIPAKVSFACAGNDICICEGEEVTLGCDNLSTSLDVTWSSSNANNLSCTDCLNPTTSPTETTTYTMVPNSNSCGNSEVTVTVYDIPQYDNLNEICNGGTYTVSFDLQVSGIPYLIAGDDGTFVGNTFTSNPIPDGVPYNFEIGDDGICSVIIESVKTCDCSVSATISGNETICIESDDDNATIEVNIEGGTGNYNFTYAKDGIAQPSINTSENNYQIEISESATYTLLNITDGLCNGQISGNANINLIPKPNASIIPVPDQCIDSEIVEINVLETGGTLVGKGTFENDTAYFFSAQNAGIGEHDITYSFDGPCPAEQTFKIDVKSCIPDCNFYAPNVFSPNRSDLNETWKVESDCDFSSYRLTIFNRWGELVFESSNPDAEWDGTFKGKKPNTGVFVYVVEASSQMEMLNYEQYKKGNITLLR